MPGGPHHRVGTDRRQRRLAVGRQPQPGPHTVRRGGLIAVRQTERDQQYPERTVYEVTDEGRAVTREWLEQMLSAPKAEFPLFPAALSNMLMLNPDEVAPILEQRAVRLAAQRADLERGFTEAPTGLPRITLIENEYLLAVLDAEQRWLQGVISDLRDGSLTWSPEMLATFQEAASGDAARDG
ncbi:PadR family transcriptional regulator [Streptomyces tubercidicus]|uniref:PadR family transcriptional regulator n=1 Tax=Streptomyces tubercidicus TaxID=47759 RepID=UPI003467B629